jgi:hypothetical protein
MFAVSKVINSEKKESELPYSQLIITEKNNWPEEFFRPSKVIPISLIVTLRYIQIHSHPTRFQSIIYYQPFLYQKNSYFQRHFYHSPLL